MEPINQAVIVGCLVGLLISTMFAVCRLHDITTSIDKLTAAYRDLRQ